MKKLITGISSIVVLLSFVMPVFAAGKSSPKATGSVDYSAYNLERHAEFNAIATSNVSTYKWDVSGNWGLMYTYNGTDNPYLYNVSISQASDGTLSGTGEYPMGLPTQYAWTLEGEVDGENVHILATYYLGTAGTVMHMYGTIDPQGKLSGTWEDNYQGTRTGTWYSQTGTANMITSTYSDAKGSFHYSDISGNHYVADIRYVKVEDEEAWFAGEVVSGNIGVGSWLFVKVLDGGEPSYNADHIWGSFTSELDALNGVSMMSNPADGAFAIQGGNIQVH